MPPCKKSAVFFNIVQKAFFMPLVYAAKGPFVLYKLTMLKNCTFHTQRLPLVGQLILTVWAFFKASCNCIYADPPTKNIHQENIAKAHGLRH